MLRRGAIQLGVIALVGVTVGLLVSSRGSEDTRASGYYPNQAGQTSPADGITVTGVGRARVKKPLDRSERTIARAVAAAQRAAFVEGVAQARRQADQLASTLCIVLGDVEAAAESEDPYSSGDFGRFSGGRYCGKPTRRIFRNGRTIRRLADHRSCFVPRESVVILTVRFEKG